MLTILILACHRTPTDDGTTATDSTIHTGENCGEPIPGGPGEYYTYLWGFDYKDGPFEDEGCWVEDPYPGCEAMFGSTGDGACPDLDEFVELSHWFDAQDPNKQLVLCTEYALAFWKQWGAQQAAAFRWPSRELDHFVFRRSERAGPWCCGGVPFFEVGYRKGSSVAPAYCPPSWYVRDLTPEDFN